MGWPILGAVANSLCQHAIGVLCLLHIDQSYRRAYAVIDNFIFALFICIEHNKKTNNNGSLNY